MIADAKALLEAAERALDEGDNTASVRASAEAYAAIVSERPDLVFAPPSFGDLPITGGREPGAGVPHAPWPDQGVTVTIAEGAAPEILLDKQRYTMSDAITYLEYTVDLLRLAER